ncbi:4Fe-4S dicluster domain-containing protein [Fastidiosibacter lacustris]|uniref:4Fe-4S dicluster domain-containing protein n=1 Tax=Fastidiosibacter lacustris TaxID=2056695 RepID=UPI000E351D4D|nr:4Fe-4S dicluster domain-containing protein [Fastidiosibacter lacustris]
MSQFYFLPHTSLDDLIHYLKQEGFMVKAPIVSEGAIVYDDIEKAAELPWGYIDEQSPAHYKVTKTNAKAAFGWSLPVQSVKPMLFKEKEKLWRVKRDKNGTLQFESCLNKRKYAVLGVRPCDLRAIEIQDRVFIENAYQDVRYKVRREAMFIIAANCTTCHSNCFCISLGDSPFADKGYDLAMTEIDHGFVVESGGDSGRMLIEYLQLQVASGAQTHIAYQKVNGVYGKQNKSIPPLAQVEKALFEEHDHPKWEDVAKRCLSCGNCTQACPTCFCHTEKESPSLDGKESTHVREWDSCFGLDHSYTHGKLYRDKPKYRYRQWLTHKFSTWREQFRTKGCVGCGRCITWCPVSIDVTEEINIICQGTNK